MFFVHSLIFLFVHLFEFNPYAFVQFLYIDLVFVPIYVFSPFLCFVFISFIFPFAAAAADISISVILISNKTQLDALSMHLLPLVKMANNVSANLEEKELYDKRDEYELQEIEDNLGSSVSARLSRFRRDWRSQDSGLVFYRHFWNKVIIPPHNRCLEYSLSPLI